MGSLYKSVTGNLLKNSSAMRIEFFKDVKILFIKQYRIILQIIIQLQSFITLEIEIWLS